MLGAGQESNEGVANSRDVAQAIANEEAIDSVEQATSSRAEITSQAMRTCLLRSREKRSNLSHSLQWNVSIFSSLV